MVKASQQLIDSRFNSAIKLMKNRVSFGKACKHLGFDSSFLYDNMSVEQRRLLDEVRYAEVFLYPQSGRYRKGQP